MTSLLISLKTYTERLFQLVAVVLVLHQVSLHAQTRFPLSPKATAALVDSLARQISKYYVDEEAALKMSVHLTKCQKEGRYGRIADPHVLAARLTSDVLSVSPDEHFHVEYNPVLANEISGNVEDVPGMVAEKLRQERARNFGFRKAEILSGNIGYLEISSFSRLNDYSRAAADAALNLVSNCSALIIDLRYGAGGSPEMVTYLLGRFFKEKTHVNDIYIRSEKLTIPYYTKPDSTSPLSEVPVYLLTSYKTFSAAEGFIYALQTYRRGTVVGEVTRGGAHTVTYRPLSSGFVADIPFGKAISPVTKANWERVGIQPDYLVSAAQALEVAEAKIFESAYQRAKDSTEKKRLKWHYQLLQAHNHPLNLDSATLARFTGDYGAYRVSYDHGSLYYQKTGKAKFPLVPVTKTCLMPRGNDSFIVEFFTDESGKPARMATSYDDGRVEYALKEK